MQGEHNRRRVQTKVKNLLEDGSKGDYVPASTRTTSSKKSEPSSNNDGVGKKFKHCDKGSSEGIGDPTTVTEGNFAMGASQERQRDADGFERWVTPKTVIRKATSTRKNVSVVSSPRRAQVLVDTVFSAPPASVASQGKNRTMRPEGGKKKLQRKGRVHAQTQDVTSVCDGMEECLLSGQPPSRSQNVVADDASRFPATTSCGEEVDNLEKQRTRVKGKAKVDAVVSMVDLSADAEDLEDRGLSKDLFVNDDDDHTSDSDFQHTPERRPESTVIAKRPLQGFRQKAANEPRQVPRTKHSLQKRGLTRVQIREDDKYETKEEEGQRLHTVKEGLSRRALKTSRIGSASKPRRLQLEGDSATCFPFEQPVSEDEFVDTGEGGPSNSLVQYDSEDKVGEAGPHGRGGSGMAQRAVLAESEARAERKRKQAEREMAVREREASGKKPYFIMVNARGKPYGDDVTAWRAELNKLCRALDPSIRDVRQQPHQKIQIMKKRLTDNFDYSGVISDKHLLPLIGSRLSTTRNELINDIKASRNCSSGVDPGAWERLERICESASFQRKSEAMRYANSYRHSLGRTGLGGEISVWESLKESLGRSPDPEEVQMEMSRDKGYGGKKKPKKMGRPQGTRVLGVGVKKKGIDCGHESSDDFQEEVKGASLKKKKATSAANVMKETCVDHMELINKLQAEIENLKSRMDANVCQSSAAYTSPPVQSMKMGAPALAVDAVPHHVI